MRLTSAYRRTKCSLRAHFATDAEKERFRALQIGGCWVLPHLLRSCRLPDSTSPAAVRRLQSIALHNSTVRFSVAPLANDPMCLIRSRDTKAK